MTKAKQGISMLKAVYVNASGYARLVGKYGSFDLTDELSKGAQVEFACPTDYGAFLILDCPTTRLGGHAAPKKRKK